MPFNGRPSTGCQTCRRRKIKCDCARPACMNCAKARWTCPGYRNLVDLLYRDENAKLAKKFKPAARTPNSTEISRDAAEHSQDNCKFHTRLGKSESEVTHSRTHRAQNQAILGSVLPYDLEKLAIGFFFHHYVVPLHADVHDVWGAVDNSSCLSTSIIALGAAGVTKSGLGQACSPEVQSKYLNAIRCTNSALRSPVDVEKDSTLLAINLLGTFEVIAGSPKTLDPWYCHIQGAAALLQYRGMKQFKTADGGRLFVQTCSNLIMSCVGRRFPVPSHIHILTARATAEIPDPTDPAWRCLLLNLRYVDLYTRLLPNNMLHSPEEARPVLEEAFSLDQDMLALLDDYTDDWGFEMVSVDGPTVFAKYMYVFRHFVVVQQYISLVYKRIVLHDIMLKAYRSHPDPKSLNLPASTIYHVRNVSEIIRQLQCDILAVFPQFLENSFSRFDSISQHSTRPSENNPKGSMRTIYTLKDQNPWRSRRNQHPRLPFVRNGCGYTIQWPLYIAGAADAMDGKVRAWVVGILRTLGQNMGLQQALLLATSLGKGEGEQLNTHLLFSAETEC